MRVYGGRDTHNRRARPANTRDGRTHPYRISFFSRRPKMKTRLTFPPPSLSPPKGCFSATKVDHIISCLRLMKRTTAHSISYIEYFIRVFLPSDLESSFVRPLSATPLMEILGFSIDTENDFFCTIVRIIYFLNLYQINDFTLWFSSKTITHS